MLTFSDYILSKRPWAYCRLSDEENSTVFLDQTNQGNQLYSPEINGQFIQITENKKNNPILGDTAGKCLAILPAYKVLEDLKIKWTLPEDKGIGFRISPFLTNNQIYRSRIKIQQPLNIHDFWADFILINFSPNFYLDYGKNFLDELWASNGADFKLDETPTYDDDFLGYHGSIQNLQLSYKNSYDCYELQASLGSIKIYTLTRVWFDYLGISTKQSLFLKIFLKCYENDEPTEVELYSQLLIDRNWTGIQYDTVETNPYKTELTRFTLGLRQTSQSSIFFHMSINGENQNITQVNLNSLILDLSNFHNYKDVKFFGPNQYSNISIFFNIPFPSDNWLSSSEAALLRTETSEYFESDAIKFSSDDNLPRIERHPGSFNQFLTSVLCLGGNHSELASIQWAGTYSLIFDVLTANADPLFSGGEISNGIQIKLDDNKQSPFVGTWKIESVTNTSLTCIPSETCEISCKLTTPSGSHQVSKIKLASGNSLTCSTHFVHSFRVGDIILINAQYLDEQSYLWEVINKTGSSFQITLKNLSLILNTEGIVIRKAPLGGFNVWKKIWDDSKACFYGKALQSKPQCLKINDQNKYSAKVKMSNLDFTKSSEEGYFIKDIKNNLTKISNIDFTMIGDAFRFFAFVASKQISPSQSQILVFGDIDEYPNNDDFQTFLISYNNTGPVIDCNFNHAFLYPNWTILPSGHLLCQSHSASISSDIRTHENSDKIINVFDGGHHIYPDNFRITRALSPSIREGTELMIKPYLSTDDFYDFYDQFTCLSASYTGGWCDITVELPDSNEFIFVDKLRLSGIIERYRVGYRNIPIISATKNINGRWVIVTEENHNLKLNGYFEKILGSNKGTSYDAAVVYDSVGYYYNPAKTIIEVVNDTSFLIVNIFRDATNDFVYDPQSGYDKMYIQVPIFLFGNTNPIISKVGPDINGQSVYTIRFFSDGIINNKTIHASIKLGQLSTFTYF